MASLFSIIVPVYNKSRTLHQCIDSVLSQDFTSWELLLIDDGSKDNSLEILNSYTDNRIRVLHHENHGVSYTRNRGIREAVGEYVIFLDADDYWNQGYLRCIADSIERYSAEVYITGITKIMRDGHIEQFQLPYQGVVDKSELLRDFYSLQRKTQLYGYVPNKIFKRVFYLDNNLLFDENIKMAEDLELFLRCYQIINSFCFVNDCGYFYVMYDGGTSMYSKNVNYFSLIDIHNKLKDFCMPYLSEEDKVYYNNFVNALAIDAITETCPLDILSIPRKVNLLKERNLWESTGLSDCMPWLILKTFLHRVRIDTYQALFHFSRQIFRD